MDKIIFGNLLLKTIFCCMASDGHIDEREIKIIKSLCEKSPLFDKINLVKEINSLVTEINTKGKKFVQDYLRMLENIDLTEEETLTLIDFALQTIKADEQVEYSEIKFFKILRHRLKISNDVILNVYPDIEMFLEEDIITSSLLEKITKKYLQEIELPQIQSFKINDIFNDDSNEQR